MNNRADIAFEEELRRRTLISSEEYREGDTLFMSVVSKRKEDDSFEENIKGHYIWMLKRSGSPRFKTLPINGSIMTRKNPLRLDDDGSIFRCITPDDTEIEVTIKVSSIYDKTEEILFYKEDLRFQKEYYGQENSELSLRPEVRNKDILHNENIVFKWYHEDQLLATTNKPMLIINPLTFNEVGVYKMEIRNKVEPEEVMWSYHTKVLMKVKMKK